MSLTLDEINKGLEEVKLRLVDMVDLLARIEKNTIDIKAENNRNTGQDEVLLAAFKSK